MNEISNGTVLPFGLLSANTTAGEQGFENAFNNKSLKAGVVVKSYMPNDPENFTGLLPEYDVMVIEQNSNLGPSTRTYRHCVSSQGLGSIADYFEYTLRHQTKTDKSNNGMDFNKQDGATVLVLCLDANEEKAIIIGAIRHPDRKSKLTEDNVLSGAFNGASIDIKKDGSIQAKFVGATDNKGDPLNKELGPTTIDIEKDGSFQVKNKGVTQRMAKDGSYSVASEKGQSFTSKEGVDFTAEKSFTVKAKDTLSAEAKEAILKIQSSISAECQTLKIKAQTETNLETAMLNVKASGMAKIQAPVITADGLCFLGGNGGLPVLRLNTVTLGIGAFSVPVISFPISGFAAKTLAV